MIFEPWESWCEEFLEDPGSLWQPLCYEAGETHAAVSKCFRNNVLGNWQSVLGPGNALKLQRNIARAGEACHAAVSKCYRNRF